MRFGFLDLCKRSPHRSSGEALHETLDLAKLADELGYSRFWVAEHHVEDSASACPEILTGLIAASTKSIRVGSGGVLLRYYSPFKVAESFLLLEALFPGRIDLGVARGPGVTSDETAKILVGGNEWELRSEIFDEKVFALTRYLRHAKPALANHAPRPWGVTPPPVWLLGSGSNSAKLAATLGVPYGFSLFFDRDKKYNPDPISEYREHFKPSEEHLKAQVSVAASVLCLPDAAQARARHDAMVRAGYLASNAVGDPAQCADQLRTIARRLGAEELIITTWLQDASERRFTLESLAKR